MKQALALILIGTTLTAGLPVSASAQPAPEAVELDLDRSLTPKRIYRRAKQQVYEVCQVKGRGLVTRRDRVQSCANPMLAEFVLGSDIQELVEIFEKRTGEKLLS